MFTEALQHQLRNIPGCAITAHLLIPGFVFTSLTANGRTEKPPAAWTPEQTVDFMFDRLACGDFYMLCPDNDVSRELDEYRIAWAAGDITLNPAVDFGCWAGGEVLRPLVVLAWGKTRRQA